METYKVLIADDHQVVRQGLSAILSYQDDLHFEVTTCVNGQEMLDLAAQNTYDIILLDISMPVMDGIEALKILKTEMHSDIPVLMITSHDSKHMITATNELGSSGYVLKNAEEKDLIEAITSVLHKQKYFSKEIAAIMAQANGTDDYAKLDSLSKKEKQILVLILNEKTNQTIANELNLSIRTIEGHRERIMKKLGVSSTIGLVKFALKTGFN
jgi:DNA-binding NarL/FixJ family response regulator